MAAEHEHHLQPEEGYKPYDLDVDMVEDYTPDPYDCCTEDSNSTSEYSSGMPDQSCPVKLRCSSSTYDPAACFNSRGIPHESLPVGLVIDRRFKITGLLGKGSFAAAYAAQCLETGEEEVVIKARVSTSGATFSQSLANELEVYQKLGAAERVGIITGIPRLYSAGVHKLCPVAGAQGDDCMPGAVFVSYIAIQRLGPSIWGGCHTKQDGQPWQPTQDDVIQMGKGMLKALASIHAKGYIHKDVKTDNFCLGAYAESLGSIYAIDYGFARPAYGLYDYKAYNTAHASYWGTPNYASLSSLLLHPQTPRDDLEALTYCLLELEMDGCYLPWNLTTNSEAAAGWTDEQLKRMERDKRAAWQDACQEGMVPPYIAAMFDYIIELTPAHVPDYSYLLRLLECGLTEQPFPGRPHPQHYSAWPAAGPKHDHGAVTASVLQELSAAASMVLTAATVEQLSYGATNTAVQDTAAPSESEQEQQGHKRHIANELLYSWDGQASVEGGCEGQGQGTAVAFDLEDEVDSVDMCLSQQLKRRRVAAAPAVGVDAHSTKHMLAQPAAALTAALREGSQPEE